MVHVVYCDTMLRCVRYLASGCAVVLVAFPARAFAFDANVIISDHALTNVATMTLGDVHRWLQDRESILATVFQPDSEGLLKFPHEILWFAAQEARVNPQVLLTMLQKEQSLIDGRAPTQSQYDWAMGYGCPDGSGCNPRFQGFGKQVRGAALQLRGYLDDLAQKGETIARWAVGRSRQTADGYTVTPSNSATAALYSYTPWRGGANGTGGNYSFARLFGSWFGSGRYPDGAVLRGSDGAVWRILHGRRQRFTSPAVLHSYIPAEKVIVVSDTDISAYREGPAIRFPNYTVLEDAAGVRWLLVDQDRRKIVSQELFRRLGFHPEEVEAGQSSDFEAFEVGTAISSPDDSPRGAVVVEIGTNREFFVTGATKHPIPHPAIREARFPGQRMQPRLPKDLAALRVGTSVTLPDGELVTAPAFLPQVFIISQGKRRPFTAPRVLEQLGYAWGNLRVLSNDALTLHPEGAPLTGGFDSGDVTGAAPSVPASPVPAAASAVPWHSLSIF